MNEAYFFDTYAIIEIMKGNPNYAKYNHSKIIITVFNLVELHYKLLRDFNRKIAKKVVNEYKHHVVDIDIDSIFEANEFKLMHKKKRLSAPDCIGYAVALKYGVKFLTGDKEFSGIKNVEFVK